MQRYLLYSVIAGIIVLYIGTYFIEENCPVAEISLGTLEGYYRTSYGGRKFAAFEGIPYAKPPIGYLRFEPPQEPKPWTSVWKANKVRTCLQIIWVIGILLGDEDCLYLNIYVPNNTTNLDVLVYIHGGAFMLGNPEMGGPGYLMDRNIVYVTINYRLGPLGFLSTEDNVVPGNMGLKDQSMALTWIQKHIKNFGGNPKSVTIIGASAGAASVHFHYFSPLSRGLFHKGISQGGTALAPWAIHKTPLKTAKKLAATIGCDTPSTAEMIDCMKNQSGSNVVENAYSLGDVKNFPLAPFAPVVEKSSSGAFLSDCPYKLLNGGKIVDIPWISGGVTEEGALGLIGLQFNYDNLNENWDSILNAVLNYEDVIDDKDKFSIAQNIKQFYLNGNNITNENVLDFVKLFGDRYFYSGLEEAVRLQAKAVTTTMYTYMYGYKTNLQNILEYLGIIKDYGVWHVSDGGLLYTAKYFEHIQKIFLSSDDIKTKDIVLDIVTSFAKNGKPVVNGIKWNPVTVDSDDINYLVVGNNEVRSVSKPQLVEKKFWKSLPIKDHDC